MTLTRETLMARDYEKPEKRYPPEPDWKCLWCQMTVKGGTIHRCSK